METRAFISDNTDLYNTDQIIYEKKSSNIIFTCGPILTEL